MKIAVTGAQGFIGRHLTTALAGRGHAVVPIGHDDWDLTSEASPAALLAGCDAVVHLAAAVHRRGRPGDADFVRTMMATNLGGTERLARAAAAAGVARFVFLSSAAVYGRGAGHGTIDEATPLAPDTPYGESKRAAEAALQAIAEETGLGTVALRPPLVYGPGAPGNFATLVRLASRGLPVPSGALAARRARIAVTNLCDLVACALAADRPPRRAYVAAEPAGPIADIYRGLCVAAGRKPRVVPFPRGVLRLALRLAGRAETASVLDDFVMDASAARRDLGWAPRDLLAEELGRAMAAAGRP